MRVLPVLLVLASACGAEDAPPTSPTDAGTPMEDGGEPADLGPAPSVVVGTGQNRFEALPEDGSATFPLVLGPQGGGRFGGHHVLLAVLLEGLVNSDLEQLEVRVLDDAGARQGQLLRASTSPFINGRELPNLAVRVDDCCLIANQSIQVEAVARRPDGSTLTHRVAGTASACPQPSQGASICP